MKISLNWLNNYIESNLSPEEIGAILTSTGLEVESIEKIETVKGGLVGVIVGEVLLKEKHADADRLNVTKVDIGTGTNLQIVCGASNVEVGQKVLVATVNSTIYPKSGDALKIKKSKIRGIESEGMICAEDELGLGNSHDGIMVLPADSTIGMAAKDLFNIEEDCLFEIGLTPNRADAMGHIGVARDIKAYLNFHAKKNLTLNIPQTQYTELKSSNEIKISVQDPISCPRYSGAVIKNICVADSPKWLQTKLATIGLKPINNIVDITNYVMFETGNPLHAFDLNSVGNEIIVRNAKPEETITTLDGNTRKLSDEDLLICNSTEPMCIAGIFGGHQSGINNSTKNVFLETAYFNSTTIRRTAKSIGLSTDSSFRFERGVDPNNIDFARSRAIQLILEIAGGELVQVVDLYPKPIEPIIVEFSFDNCRKLCGAQISDEDILFILNELEIKAINKNNGGVSLSIPTYRVDVKREADVIEEVLRIYGFNAVSLPKKLNTSILPMQKPNNEKLLNLIANLLVDNGYFEILNNSLTSSNTLTKVGSNQFIPENNVTIMNPLSNELDVMRQSLIFGGLAAIEHNQNRQNQDLKLFEFGKVYSKTNSGYNETRKLSIFITGERRAENWTHISERSNFFTLKGVVEKIISRFGLSDLQVNESLTNDLFEDGYSILIAKKKIAEIGWVKKSIQKMMGIKNTVFCAEFDWDVLLDFASKTKTQFSVLPKTQFVRRDYSLLLDEAIRFEQIKKIAQNSEKTLLKKVGLFDVYDGKNLESGKKSYAVSFQFQDNDKTLLDDQIDTIMQTIKSKLEAELGAELR